MTIELNPITSGYSTGLINDNFQAIEDYVNDKLLQRDGVETGEINQMEVDLDMNSHFVYNLPEPVLEHQAARLQDVQNAVAGGAANLITFTPYGNISSDNVQGAIQELADGTGQALTTSTGEQTLTQSLDSRVIYRSSVSDMQAIPTGSLINGQIINVRGSEFRWDGASFTPEGRVSVHAFGAEGDGTTNDSAAFQAAIDSGWPLLIPKGIFPVDGLVVGAVSFDILGLGQESVLLHQANTVETNAFDMSSANGTFVIDNCKINCNRQNHVAPPTDVRFFSAPQNPNGITFIMRNCRVENVHTNALWVQTDNITRATVKVIDNSFYDIIEGADSAWNPSFVTFSENVDFEASGNEFRAGYTFTQDGAMAINHSSRNAADPVNEYARVRIVGNYFEGLGRNAPVSGNALGCIELRLWTEITVISGNNFRGCYHTPIRGKTDCKEVAISGNTIRNCNGGGIEMLRGVSTGPIIGRMSITGNVISTPETNGITVSGNSTDVSEEWAINGNVISNAGGKGIEISWANNVNINGNTVFNSAGNGIDALECDTVNITGNNTDSTGDASGIVAINCPYVVCSNNNVNDADDVGVRVGGVTKATVCGNLVSRRNNVSGSDVDYRLTNGTTLIALGNIGTTSSSFGFTTSIIVNNEF